MENMSLQELKDAEEQEMAYLEVERRYNVLYDNSEDVSPAQQMATLEIFEEIYGKNATIIDLSSL